MVTACIFSFYLVSTLELNQINSLERLAPLCSIVSVTHEIRPSHPPNERFPRPVRRRVFLLILSFVVLFLKKYGTEINDTVFRLCVHVCECLCVCLSFNLSFDTHFSECDQNTVGYFIHHDNDHLTCRRDPISSFGSSSFCCFLLQKT